MLKGRTAAHLISPPGVPDQHISPGLKIPTPSPGVARADHRAFARTMRLPMKIDPNGPKVDWAAMEAAFEHNAPQTSSYLDLQTGGVLTVVENRLEDLDVRQSVRREPGRYVRLTPASSREQYRWMERFVTSVVDEGLRERLILAIDGKGAFRRFKDVLLSYPAEHDRWFVYRSTLLRIYINDWLSTRDITLGEGPPWGEQEQPPEPDIPLEKPAGAREGGPSDALRKQARDLLEELPALELPAAVAYLRFLAQHMPSVDENGP